jgi:N6-L-threonylcarbamoyladenine synthase
MIVLGIETTFDETAAAVLEIKEEKRKPVKILVLANIVSSQIRKHKKFGGVVPQLAAKLHQENFIPVLEKTLKTAKIKSEKIDLI